MTLKTMHQLLIVSALLLGVLMMGFAFARYAGGDASLLPMGVLGGLSALALGFYLRWFRRKRVL